MKRLALLVAALALIAALALWSAPAPIRHPYFDGAPAVEIIAHGGGQGVMPTNTLPALAEAARMGADVLEIDVQQTADGALILMHDDTLDRTTDLSGAVALMTLDQVRAADAGANRENGLDFSGRDIGVPTLAEAFAQHPEARWVIEIKPQTNAAAVALCQSIRADDAQARVLVGTFHDATMAAFRHACPEVATSMARTEATLFVLAAYAGLSRFVQTPAAALQIPTRAGVIDGTTSRVINAAHARGFKVQYWTINDEAEMRTLIARGADGIITDFVARGIAARR